MMKKAILGMAAAATLTACQESGKPVMNKTANDTVGVVTEVMMSRRSIRAYKDSVIDRTTHVSLTVTRCHVTCLTSLSRRNGAHTSS